VSRTPPQRTAEPGSIPEARLCPNHSAPFVPRCATPIVRPAGRDLEKDTQTVITAIGCPAGCPLSSHECGVGEPIDDRAQYDSHTAYTLGLGCGNDADCPGREGRA